MMQGQNESSGTASMVSDALRLLRAGNLEAGLPRYQQLIDASPEKVPVGVHAGMLQRLGRGSAARAIMEAGLRRGCDLSVRAALPGAEPAMAAREYEGLFERGLVNSWMVSRYLIALDRLGRSDEVAALHDVTRCVRILRLGETVGLDAGDELAAAVCRAVLANEHAAQYETKSQSVRLMHNLVGLEDIPEPAFERLASVIRGRVEQLIEQWKPGVHPLSRWCPSRFSLRMWALTSRGEGFNRPHVHHVGWYTGVFYATNIDGGGGELMIGRPQEVDQAAPGWPDLRIRPEAGMLVLMPSYFTHWTVPLARPGLRISAAFDVIEEP